MVGSQALSPDALQARVLNHRRELNGIALRFAALAKKEKKRLNGRLVHYQKATQDMNEVLETIQNDIPDE